MPRQARQKSGSGFYHILLHAAGQQDIFIDNDDRHTFKSILRRYTGELSFEIHAYCLMDNHIHLLLYDPRNKPEIIMKKVSVSYVYYYNRKYGKAGSLFRDRYKSEPVEDDAYFLAVLKHIHQNPVKAGETYDPQHNRSSHTEYIGQAGLAVTGFALRLLGGVDDYLKFMDGEEEQDCLEIIERVRITDDTAIEIIRRLAGDVPVSDIQNLPKPARDHILASAKSEGLSVRRISRITGINRGVVLQAKFI